MATETPGSGAWAGAEYQGASPVITYESGHWTCLSCGRHGTKADLATARAHAAEARHLVAVSAMTTYVPAERIES